MSRASQYFEKLSAYSSWVKEARGYPSAGGRMVVPQLSERAASAGRGMTLPPRGYSEDPNSQGQGAPVRRAEAQSPQRRAAQTQQVEIPSGQTRPTPSYGDVRIQQATRAASVNQGSSAAQAQLAANSRRALAGEVSGQSYQDWSKGREGWTEDARRRRYARSAEGLAYAANTRQADS